MTSWFFWVFVASLVGHGSAQATNSTTCESAGYYCTTSLFRNINSNIGCANDEETVKTDLVWVTTRTYTCDNQNTSTETYTECSNTGVYSGGVVVSGYSNWRRVPFWLTGLDRGDDEWYPSPPTYINAAGFREFTCANVSNPLVLNGQVICRYYMKISVPNHQAVYIRNFVIQGVLGYSNRARFVIWKQYVDNSVWYMHYNQELYFANNMGVTVAIDDMRDPRGVIKSIIVYLDYTLEDHRATVAAVDMGTYTRTVVPNGTCVADTVLKRCSCVRRAELSKCLPGRYCTNTTKNVECSVGSYCPAGSVSDSPCPIGSFCKNTTTIESCKSYQLCPLGSTAPRDMMVDGVQLSRNDTLVVCGAGLVCVNLTAIPCPEGFFCPGPTFTSKCDLPGQQCGSGDIHVRTGARPGDIGFVESLVVLLNDTNAYCAMDKPVSYCVNTRPPEACPLSRYCPPGSSVPLFLPVVGTYYDTRYDIRLCPNGYICAGGRSAPVRCPGGSYCPPLELDLECAFEGQACPIGMIHTTGGNLSTLAPVVDPAVECKGPGSWCIRVLEPKLCPIGTYCPVGSISPTPCASGQYCPENSTVSQGCPALTDCENPVDIITCASPGYSCNGSLSKCQAGYYCTNTSKNLECPLGSYCPTGSVSASACPAGSFCKDAQSIEACKVYQVCPLGSTAPQNMTLNGVRLGANDELVLCDAGTICVNLTVVVCPEGSLCPVPIYVEMCDLPGRRCSDGGTHVRSTGSPSEPGFTGPVEIVIGDGVTDCVEGGLTSYCMYVPLPGACPPLRYCPLGSSEPVFLPVVGTYYGANYDIILCPMGYSCAGGLTAPVLCPSGYYCPPLEVIVECTTEALVCPDGTIHVSVGNLSAMAPILDPTNLCSGPESSCVRVPEPEVCPVGTYCPEGSIDPTPCASGQYCPVNSTEPLDCPSSTNCSDPANLITCGSPGYYCNDTGVLHKCRAGYYCTNTSKNIPCSVGSYCPRGSERDSPCPVGSFCNDTLSMERCKLYESCPSGSIAPQNMTMNGFVLGANDTLVLCQPGLICSNLSARLCPSGSFCPLPTFRRQCGLPAQQCDGKDVYVRAAGNPDSLGFMASVEVVRSDDYVDCTNDDVVYYCMSTPLPQPCSPFQYCPSGSSRPQPMSSADTTTSPVDTTTPVDETSEGFWDKYGLYVIVVGSVLVFVVVVYYFFLRNDTRDGTIADVMRCDEYRKLREALS